MDISVSGLKKPLEVSMIFSRINNNSDWNTRTSVNSRYREVPLDEITKKLANLSGT